VMIGRGNPRIPVNCHWTRRWQRETGYGKRAKAETAMARCNALSDPPAPAG
jgi:hypothetical protein